MRPVRLLASVLVVLLLTATATAAASGRDVLRDCTDDEQLSKRYSQADYAHALRLLSTIEEEYSGCEEVIRRARNNALAGDTGGGGGAAGGASGGGSATGGGGAGGGGGGAAGAAAPLASPSPQESAALEQARRGGGEATRLSGGQLVSAAQGRTPGVSAGSELPTPLLVLLVLLGAGTLGLGATRLRGHVLRRRPA